MQISPQFGDINPNHGKRRQVRRHHSNKHSIASNKENSRTCSRSGTRQKFPALNFVGDKGETPQNPQSKKPRGTNPLQKQHGEQSISTQSADESFDAESQHAVQVKDLGLSHEEYNHVETVRKRRSSFRKSVGQKHRPSLACRSVQAESPWCASPELPAHMQVSSPVSQALIGLGPAADKDDSVLPQVAVGNRRKSYNSDILLSPLETSSLTQNNASSITPNFTGLNPLPLRMTLFGPSPSEQADWNSSNISSKSLDSSVCSKMDASLKGYKPSSRKNGRDEERKGSLRPTTLDDNGSQRPRRSRRLQEKYKEALKYLQPGTPSGGQNVRILVTDTPEAEYSLTFRQRQRLKPCL